MKFRSRLHSLAALLGSMAFVTSGITAQVVPAPSAGVQTSADTPGAPASPSASAGRADSNSMGTSNPPADSTAGDPPAATPPQPIRLTPPSASATTAPAAAADSASPAAESSAPAPAATAVVPAAETSAPPPAPSPVPEAPTSAAVAQPHPAGETGSGRSATYLDRAWTLLTETAAAGKNPNDRIQALAALSAMGSDEHAQRLISAAFTSKDVDVRIAAVLAAAQSRNPRLLPRLREAMDDPDPQVAFTAATALWKNHDHSSEQLLMAVAMGDRKPNESLVKGLKHKEQQEIHNPKLMATQGLEAGAGFVLGPAGFGIKAVEYAKGSGGGVARAEAINLLAESHTEQVHRALVESLSDKEAAVRAAAARALGNWPGQETSNELAPMMEDNKLSVRMQAAAAYIRSTPTHAHR